MADTAFGLNAIDRGIDRLIERPNRTTTGKTLASRLARDGRKHLKANRRREVLSDYIETDELRPGPLTDIELADIHWAVGVIKIGLMSLTPRDRQVLATKANASPAEDLAVKPRQFRNLVAAARVRLWRHPGVEMACIVIMDGIDRWRFETIELMAPLVGCMTTSV